MDRARRLCESRGGRPGRPSLIVLVCGPSSVDSPRVVTLGPVDKTNNKTRQNKTKKQKTKLFCLVLWLLMAFKNTRNFSSLLT